MPTHEEQSANHESHLTEAFVTCQTFLTIKERIVWGRTMCLVNTEFITRGGNFALTIVTLYLFFQND